MNSSSMFDVYDISGSGNDAKSYSPIGGSGATFTITVTTGAITTFTLGSGGTGYSPTASGATWARSGTTITVTFKNHGIANGVSVYVTVSSDSSAIPITTSYATTYVDANTFTFTANNAGLTSGTLSYTYPLTNATLYFYDKTGATGIGASGTYTTNAQGVIQSVALTNGGSGYTNGQVGISLPAFSPIAINSDISGKRNFGYVDYTVPKVIRTNNPLTTIFGSTNQKAWSVSLWYRNIANTGTRAIISDSIGATDTTNGLTIEQNNDGSLIATIHYLNGSSSATGNSVTTSTNSQRYDDGAWHFLCMTVDVTSTPTLTFVVDPNNSIKGHTTYTYTNTFTLSASSAAMIKAVPLCLFSKIDDNTATSYSEPVGGWINNVTLYNRALSLTEMETVYGNDFPTEVQDNLHVVGNTGEPAFQNSWVNFSTTDDQARFWKDSSGCVHVVGLVKSGSISAVIFYLPVGYRPRYRTYLATHSNNLYGTLQVLVTGEVYPSAGSTAYFSVNCSFQAES